VRRAARLLPALALLAAAAAAAEPRGVPEGEDARLGYSVGYQVGGDFRRSGVPLDAALVAEGIRDALAGSPPRLAADEMRRALTELRERTEGTETPGPAGAEDARGR
jgi:FKBP-type peptidyl-prolyl cis-trans isomerase FklB